MRPTLRATRLAGRRLNSSSAPQMNPQVQKAVESASKAFNQGAATVKRVAGPVGERIGSAMGGYREPIVYNSKVFASICRQVYQAEKLAPPTQLATWANAYSYIWARATNLGWWRNVLKTGGWVGLGIGAVEAYGIFTIGEMIGRRNVVGYKLRD